MDESGDFGAYETHSPFYLFTLVFHNQDHSVAAQIAKLEAQIQELGLSKTHCFHAGPIIRREEDYTYFSMTERRRCLNRILTFAKSCDIGYQTFHVEKKQVKDSVMLAAMLSKQLSQFLRDELSFFQSFEEVIVYYDNGQIELNRILASVFSAMLSNVTFRKVYPAQYRLFQVADFICTMELIALKMSDNQLSASELQFFGNVRTLKKNYLKPLRSLCFRTELL